MLKLHFINVADGDSILIENVENNKVYRMLVDTGRRELTPDPKSAKTTCIEYLREKGIDSIDDLVLTHMHVDHIGAVGEIAETLTVKRAYTNYVPEDYETQIPDEPEAANRIRKMISCINEYRMNLQKLKKRNTDIFPVYKTIRSMCLTDELKIDLIVTDESVVANQKMIWDGMIAGECYSEEEKTRIARMRNPASLRVRLYYRDIITELSGDCYGNTWDECASACDILKVPHHGDKKSLTQKLVEQLKPQYAVISCGRVYMPDKDRPSITAANMLREAGAKLFYTDSYDDGINKVSKWKAVIITIDENGMISAPV